MVMITRNACRRACESFDSSGVSQKTVFPPWCSSGKHERKRRKRLTTPTWEKISIHPLRENIWDYLKEDSSRQSFENLHSKNFRRPSIVRNEKRSPHGKYIAASFALLAALSGISVYILIPGVLPRVDLITKVIPKTNIQFLLGMKSFGDVNEECCHRLRYLAAALFRAEQALRSTQRSRRTNTLMPYTTKTEIASRYIEDVSVSKGVGTKEWGGRVALWGVVPLWHAAHPPHTILATRSPVPADCWPFRGSYGEIVFDLPRRLSVSSVSVEHIRPDTARSAPKHFQLYGILENGTWVKTFNGEYKAKGPAKQYFSPTSKNTPLKRIIFRVLSNQGNLKYTCIYRVHLYGSSLLQC